MRTEKNKAACLILLAVIMSAASSVTSATAATQGHRHAVRGQTTYYRGPAAPNGNRLQSDASVYANDPWIWSEGRE